jgi:hypothetical protein
MILVDQLQSIAVFVWNTTTEDVDVLEAIHASTVKENIEKQNICTKKKLKEREPIRVFLLLNTAHKD